MSELAFTFIIVVFLAFRQLKARPIKRSLLIVPLLMLGDGVIMAFARGVQGGEAASLLIAAALGVAAGLLQGRWLRVYQSGGVWLHAGSAASVAVWLLSVPIRYAVRYGCERLFGYHPVLVDSFAFAPFLIAVAAMLLGRAAYLAVRYPEAVREGFSMTRRKRRRLVGLRSPESE